MLPEAIKTSTPQNPLHSSFSSLCLNCLCPGLPSFTVPFTFHCTFSHMAYCPQTELITRETCRLSLPLQIRKPPDCDVPVPSLLSTDCSQKQVQSDKWCVQIFTFINVFSTKVCSHKKVFQTHHWMCNYHIIQYAALRQNLTRSFDRQCHYNSGLNIVQGHLCGAGFIWQALVKSTSIRQKKCRQKSGK